MAYDGTYLMIGSIGAYMTFHLALCHNIKLVFKGWANDMPTLFETTDREKIEDIFKQFVQIFQASCFQYIRDEKTISV
jgi:hypothetical protein